MEISLNAYICNIYVRYYLSTVLYIYNDTVFYVFNVFVN